MLFKKDALHYLLNDQLEKLGLPIADKLLLRDTLANPEAYRLRMGQLTFSAGSVVAAADPPHRDLTWLGELSIPGKMFFHFVEAR